MDSGLGYFFSATNPLSVVRHLRQPVLVSFSFKPQEQHTEVLQDDVMLGRIMSHQGRILVRAIYLQTSLSFSLDVRMFLCYCVQTCKRSDV